MMGVLIGGAVLAGCAVCYQLLRSTLKEEVNHEWAGLIERRADVAPRVDEFVSEIGESLPSQCRPAFDDEAFEKVYASRNGKEALATAEEAMAVAPEDAAARVRLGYALLLSGDLVAAGKEHDTAIELGASGFLPEYLRLRVELEDYLKAIAKGGAPTDLLTPVEVLALEMHLRLADATDASPLWMPGTNGDLSQDQARELVLTHFGYYYKVLERLLDLYQEHKYGDLAYWIARLAIKSGFGDQGKTVLEGMEELMADSEFARMYKGDRAMLRGEKPVAHVHEEPGGKKRIKLNVLN